MSAFSSVQWNQICAEQVLNIPPLFQTVAVMHRKAV